MMEAALTEPSKLPTLADLTADVEGAYLNDQFNLLVNNKVPESWVKVHPFIKDYHYLPIDKVEHLLRRIFKVWNVQIIDKGTAFNGVWVHVRLTVVNPITGDIMSYDGIGASELQTKKGASAADLGNISNGALSMAFPLAKTLAIKDAADHIGTIFGSNLNRRDTLNYTADKGLENKIEDIKKDKEFQRIELLLADCQTVEAVERLQEQAPDFPLDLYTNRKTELL